MNNEKASNSEEDLYIMSSMMIASIWWNKELGDRLKALRGDETMASLAKRAGCAYQLIQHLERGEYGTEDRKNVRPSITWEKLQSICEALSVSTEDFLQIQVVKKPKKFTNGVDVLT